jgi:2-iminobutanoate/2-iminopropanoate deaminase
MKRIAIQTQSAPAPLGHYSQGIVVEGGRTLYISGQLPIEPSTGLLVSQPDIALQAEQVLDNVAAVLAAAFMTFDHLVRVGIYLADTEHFAIINSLYAKRFAKVPPARTTIAVARFRLPILIEMDGIAVSDTELPSVEPVQ